VSSWFLLEYEAAWSGVVEPDDQAAEVGVHGYVDERPYLVDIDDELYVARVIEVAALVAVVDESAHHVVVGQPAPLQVAVGETGFVGEVDESLYRAVVAIPAPPIAKVTEWPS
jgi:hypothetical protein